MKGVVYIAYGANARREAAASLASLHRFHDWPAVVIGDGKGAQPFNPPGYGARWAKLNVDKLIPDDWQAFLYLDADTRVYADLTAGFEILSDGWDMSLTLSANQEANWLWHVGKEEREATEAMLGYRALQLQAGVMFVARNERTAALYAAWRREWQRWQGNDQAALLRALCEARVRLWILGRDWNGEQGAIIEHRFGKARA